MAGKATEKTSPHTGLITKHELGELKCLAKPPVAVKSILECVARLLGLRDCSWQACQKMLGDPSCLQNLENLDWNQIPPEQVATVKCKFLSKYECTSWTDVIVTIKHEAFYFVDVFGK